MAEYDISRIRDKALELLSLRDHSEKELLDKLLERKYQKDLSRQVIGELKARNFINDVRFATSLVEQRLRSKPMGPGGLVSLLGRKGLSRTDALAVVNSVMNDLGIEERDLARKVLDRELSGRTCDLSRRRRVAGLMIRRGFDPHLVRELMDELDEISEPVEVEVHREEL